MELRGEPRGRPVTDEQAEAVLKAVIDAGINYIDYGLSEERIGRFIGDRRAERIGRFIGDRLAEFFLASKCGCAVDEAGPKEGPSPHVFTRANVVAGVEQSLKRLNTDYLDVVQFHASPTPATLQEQGALEALLDLRRQGKVRFGARRSNRLVHAA